jgi:hypothetical protein
MKIESNDMFMIATLAIYVEALDKKKIKVFRLYLEDKVFVQDQ